MTPDAQTTFHHQSFRSPVRRRKMDVNRKLAERSFNRLNFLSTDVRTASYYNNDTLFSRLINFNFIVQPDLRIIRSCAHDDSDTKEKCYKRAGFGGRQVVCGCTEDNCNGSMSLKAMTFVPIAFIAVVAYLFHLWWN